MASAIETLRRGELKMAIRTDCAAFKSVEGLPAMPAFPICAGWRRGLAGWASVAVTTREFCDAKKRLRVLESAPAVHEHEERERAEPHVLSDESQNDESDNSDQSENGCDHQAAGASEDEPQHRPKDLTAIEGIDWQDIEDQKSAIDPGDREH